METIKTIIHYDYIQDKWFSNKLDMQTVSRAAEWPYSLLTIPPKIISIQPLTQNLQLALHSITWPVFVSRHISKTQQHDGKSCKIFISYQHLLSPAATQILAEENRNSSTTTDVIIKMSSPCNVSVYGDTVTIMNSSIISEVYSTFTFTGMSEASKFELSCSASVVACSVTAWHFPPKVHGVVLKFHWLEYITHLGHQHTL